VTKTAAEKQEKGDAIFGSTRDQQPVEDDGFGTLGTKPFKD
jgi:hypothetical protein